MDKTQFMTQLEAELNTPMAAGAIDWARLLDIIKQLLPIILPLFMTTGTPKP